MKQTELYVRQIKFNPEYCIAEKRGYPFCLSAVKDLERLRFRKQVTFLAGENGMGKSTLLEAIAVALGFNAEGGSKNFRFSTARTHSELYDAITVAKGVKHPRDGYFLRAESLYNLATDMDARDAEPSFDAPIKESYGGKSLHEQSHGESFLSLVMNRFFGRGIYLLDEPESALSPSRQMTLLSRIRQLVKQDSQFIIATHSPILMAYPEADIFVLSEKGIQLTPYQETEHYLITRQFLNHPESMLKYLLE